MRKVLNAVLASGCVLMSGQVMAQNGSVWADTKVVTIIVPYPPGTEPDILARDLSQKLAAKTAMNVIVDNKPGANTIIGTSQLIRSKADGSTLLMVDSAALAANALLYKDIPYDWKKDLKVVAEIARIDLFLSVGNQFKDKDFAQFVEYAKANPGKVNVGTGGYGHINHLGMAMLAKELGINFTYVPYKGVSPAINGTIAGEVGAVMTGALAINSHMKAGLIKPLVGSGSARNKLLADVPVAAEVNVSGMAIPSTVFSLVASAKMDDKLVNDINQTVRQELRDPAFVKQYEDRGVELRDTTPAQGQQYIADLQASFEKIMEDIGVSDQAAK
ncbi:MAG: tripartite tricarboxylate transporter substrate binding protein [Alcaligenaceae bacterium]|nr:tripartite tricarboxylate transporter substrate binding protein [Alcaligenaceae bacterium]